MNDASTKPVLVPSPAGESGELIRRLRALGHQVDHAPFLDLPLNRDSDTAHAVTALREGRYSQLVIDGPRALDVLLSYDLSLPESVQVTAVGGDAAAALREAGIEPLRTIAPFDAPGARADVDERSRGNAAVGASAAGMPAAAQPGEALLLITSAAAPVPLAGTLQNAGYTVTRVNGYRPVPVSLDIEVVRGLRLAAYSSLALPSTFLADLAGHLGIHRDIRVVTMHAAATAAAQARSLVVHGEATEPTGAALAQAVHAAVTGSR